MTAFEKTNFLWQTRQNGQRLGEWLEVLLSGDGSQAPPSTTTANSNWPLLSPRVVEVFFWLVVIALVGFLIWLLFPKLRHWVTRFTPAFVAPTGEPLPQQYSRSQWVQMAQVERQKGNYAAAVTALYMAMLEVLNDRQLIAQDRSRTDGEYLQAVKQLSRSQPYQTLIQTHERVTFAQIPVDQATYQECEQAYQVIDPDSESGNTRDSTSK
ncbi:MAG: DUF4129 domain-containing protein [Synechococcales bacterium]|nr:DUF4129 domain-containing protein [Synechococcales bacterium]